MSASRMKQLREYWKRWSLLQMSLTQTQSISSCSDMKLDNSTRFTMTTLRKSKIVRTALEYWPCTCTYRMLRKVRPCQFDLPGYATDVGRSMLTLTSTLMLRFEFFLGGGTNFPLLNLTVMPKAGRAVLWPSVHNKAPHSEVRWC